MIILIIIQKIFIQDAYFNVTYIAIDMYPIKINDYKLISNK